MKKLLLFFLSLGFVYASTAQDKNYWSAHTDAAKMPTDKAVSRLTFPT